ncbi:uncharacterized protein FA14DRAFT_159322 [Meira miltonrushii]|uniref:BTB domain-containing protein n=1 Tax=Meira miltonrushii TaxID=1280837 RepID=A0A316VM12_9BASI|nr:uncharacterized protein FA14DRAFT_159322 [Meira miltonrushii]PWN37141.1 hypothetical protein FA14DRAFT_159322 [Meira miltonrushii]
MNPRRTAADALYGGLKQDKNGNKVEGQQDTQEDTIPAPFLRALHDHLRSSLFNRTCADIRIRAFSRTYSLHRVILVQSPFFDTLLNGEFAEAKSRLGVWRKGSAGLVGQNSQQDASQSVTENEDDMMELHFDDPNITRPAFEYCIATLYGAAPTLVLPDWATPSPAFPLTKHFEPERLFQSMEGKENTQKGKTDGSTELDGESTKAYHPANPRFLLSLLAASSYLGIHSLVAQSVTLILCSITPFTVSHYLRFALGYGISGAFDAKQRCQGNASEWDWELEGPVWGMESIAKEDKLDKGTNTLSFSMAQMSMSDAQTEISESVDYGDTSFDSTSRPAMAGFQYGIETDKIGEACSCWLLRWGADTMLAEEQLNLQDESKGMDHLNAVPLLPNGRMPDLFYERSANSYSRVQSACDPPQPIIWRHPLLGGLPANWVRATISSDSFWIREEWERYEAAKRVVSMRRAFSRGDLSTFTDEEEEEEIEEEGNDSNEDDANIKIIGETEVETKGDKRNSQRSSRKGKSSDVSQSHSAVDVDDEADEVEYTLLFGEGIYYTHMSFNRLSSISNDLCPYTGQSYAPIGVLQSALWTQSELKNIILRKAGENEKQNLIDFRTREDEDEEDIRVARENYSTTARGAQETDSDRELGLVSHEDEFAKAYSTSTKRGRTSRAHMSEEGKPITLGGVTPLMQPLMPSPSSINSAADGLLSKRFFAIPVDDTIRVGENLASLAASQNQSASSRDSKHQAQLHRGSDGPTGVAAAVSPNVLSIANESKSYTSSQFFGMCNAVQLGKDLGKQGMKDSTLFSESISSPTSLHLQASHAETSPSTESSHGWTGFEPMRVGVEFYDVDRLTEKQRSYSPSFFYAGSVWNLYIQTVKKAKGLQLGIYLHRQNNNDTLPSPSRPLRSLPTSRMIGRDGSEMGGLQAARDGITYERSAHSNNVTSVIDLSPTHDDPDMQDTSTYIHDSHHPLHNIDGDSNAHLRTPTQSRSHLRSSIAGAYSLTPSPSGLGDETGRVVETSSPINKAQVQMPDVPYLDQRKILRAYFSIHCPSPMGSSLTKFSSRPDNFTLSQSWGWKSSSLLGAVYLEDGQLGTARSQISQTFRCIVTMGIV